MSKQRYKRIAGNFSGGALSLLPLALLGVAGVMVYKWFKNSGGISGILGDAVGLDKPGKEVSEATSEKSFENLNAVLAAKSLKPNALHTSIANSIFDLINETSLTLLGSIISQDAQKKIYDLYNGVSWTADDALVYQQYGIRRPNNRQSTWLGFIWDDTSGDLRQHVNRYLDGDYRIKMLALIDKAIKAYLV